MSLLQNSNAISAPADTGFYDYQIANSVRMSKSAGSTLKITAGTPTSADTFTYSWWWKRYSVTDTSTNSTLVFCAGTGGGTYVFFTFTNGSTMQANFNFTGGGYGDTRLTTNMLFRDTASWYHCVLRCDSTQASSSDRVRLYVNGVEPSYSSASVQTAVSQNEDFGFMNESGVVQSWGGISGVGTGSEGVDVQLADVILCDGQSYGADSFGEFKNGVWKPVDPSGLTFGNNGYYLKFTNSSALGEDFSGNDNDLTAANLSAHDQMLDSPTFGSSSSGNFPTLNPLFPHEDMTFSEGNLKHSTSTNNRGVMCNIAIPKTGKWYWEHLSVAFHNPGGDETHNVGVNIAHPDIDGSDRGGRSTGITYASYNGGKSVEADSTASYGSGWAEGDIVGIEFDADSGTINFSNNGSWQGDISLTTAQQAKEWFPFVGMGGATNQEIGIFNFGQDSSFAGEKTAQGNADDNGYGDFYYSPPSGALALCTGNLPVADEIDPAQTDDNYPQKLFGAEIYTGNATNGKTITLGFQPDFNWTKQRNTTRRNVLMDTTRGMGGVNTTSNNSAYLHSDGNYSQGAYTDLIRTITSTGYTLGDGNYTNSSGGSYVSWNWRANGGTTSSGSGTLTSTHQVDPSGCFSIVSYTANGSNNQTFSHGLSAKPDMVIVKSTSQTSNWPVYTSSQGATKYLKLNDTTALTDSQYYWNDTEPTSSVVTVGDNTDVNYASSQTYIAYCFANCEGYIKVGTYVGNGEGTKGNFIYTGFAVSFLLVKRLTANNWRLEDDARDTYNPRYHMLLPNSESAEDAYTDGTDYNDFLSNGFRVSVGGDSANWNASGATYIYLAMAHNPFKYATAR